MHGAYNMVNSEYYEKYREIADILVDRIGYQRKWIKCGRSRPVPAKKVIFSAAVDTIDDMEGWNRQNRKTCATSSRWPIKDEFMCRWQTESWYVIRAATYKKARLDIDIRESTLFPTNKYSRRNTNGRWKRRPRWRSPSRNRFPSREGGGNVPAHTAAAQSRVIRVHNVRVIPPGRGCFQHPSCFE